MASSDSRPPTPRPPASAARRLLVAILLVAGLWGVVELVCLGGLAYLEREKGLVYEPKAFGTLRFKQVAAIQAHLAGAPSYVVHDPDLGWSLRPGGVSMHDGFELYRANRQGLRADREYPPQPPPGRVRVAAFGDSFTHGSDVGLADTWERRLERLDPRLEVLNFGVVGYGTGQALLRYRRDGVRFHPQVAILGIMSDNPLRAVSTFRPFFFPGTGLPFTKPRFEIAGARLRLIPNPLPRNEDYRALLDEPEKTLRRLGEHDWFYRRRHARAPLDFLPSMRLLQITRQARRPPARLEDGTYDPLAEPYRVVVGIARSFAREARAGGSLPVILFLPDRRDLRRVRNAEPASYAPIAAELRRRGLRVVDSADALLRAAPEGNLRRLVPGHYSPGGNGAVAAELAAWLEERGLTTPEGVARALAAAPAASDGG